MCSPRPGPGARTGSPGVRPSLIGTPSSLTGSLDAGLGELHHHLPRGTSSDSRTSSRSSTGSRQQSCSEANCPPLLARALREDLCHRAVRVGARRVEGVVQQVLSPDAPAPGAPELGLERAQGDVPVGALVRSVAGQRTGELESGPGAAPDPPRTPPPPPARATTARRRTSSSPRAGPVPSARARAAQSGSRSRAISAPPPMSAIWPAAWTGGPSASPVRPSSPFRPR